MTREEVHEPPLVLRQLVADHPELEKRIWWLEPGDAKEVTSNI